MLDTAPSDANAHHLGGMFQRYRKILAKVVARIVKPDDIEDILQETYVRICRASQHSQIQHPKSFMVKVVRNVALNHISRADAMNHLAIMPATDESDAEDDIMENEWGTSQSPEMLAQAEEEFLIFCRAVRELPTQGRRVFILKKVYGMSQREIAGRLGISEGTVEQHLAKSMVACGNYMKLHGYARSKRGQLAKVSAR